MKIQNALLATIAATAFASPALAGDTINFGTPSGTLGTSQTYTAGSLSVTASGYNASNVATDLYGKNAGGDEVGLGLANDPSGQHEIYFGQGYVQIDVSALLGKVSNVSFFTNSTTQGEQWSVFGSNNAGSYSGAALISGTSASGGNLPSLGDWKYYDFASTSQAGGKNFLLGGLTITSSVPEPSTWVMTILGVGLIGAGLRRRDKVRVAINYA